MVIPHRCTYITPSGDAPLQTFPCPSTSEGELLWDPLSTCLTIDLQTVSSNRDMSPSHAQIQTAGAVVVDPSSGNESGSTGSWTNHAPAQTTESTAFDPSPDLDRSSDVELTSEGESSLTGSLNGRAAVDITESTIIDLTEDTDDADDADLVPENASHSDKSASDYDPPSGTDDEVSTTSERSRIRRRARKGKQRSQGGVRKSSANRRGEWLK